MNSPSEWVLFFGHFHPVVVHLPIGIIVIAILMEFFIKTPDSRTLEWTWFFAAISAGISCLFGWFLSQSGEYNTVAVERHQWTGIAVFTLAAAIWIAYRLRVQHLDNKLFKQIPIAALGVLLLVTGHLGGNLTHGSDFLTMHTPQPLRSWIGMPEKESDERPVITNVNEALAYNDIIKPILKERCWSCHNATKIKGKLRMDEMDLLKKGGKNGVIFVAGNAEESEIIHRVTLPENNDEHMPPEGKTPISKNELVLLKWWINSGADFDKKVAELKPEAEEVKIALAALVSGESKDGKILKEPSILDTPITEANPKLLDKLRNKNVLITPISGADNYLDVSTINALLSDSLINDLKQISKHIINLNLSNKALPKSTTIFLNSCENLMSLRLEGSTISDVEITQLKTLKHVIYINLFSTKTSNEGINHLATFPSLSRIYCTNTTVTEAGVKLLNTKVPDLKVFYKKATFVGLGKATDENKEKYE
jgi:uncharacterized membrane protein